MSYYVVQDKESGRRTISGPHRLWSDTQQAGCDFLDKLSRSGSVQDLLRENLIAENYVHCIHGLTIRLVHERQLADDPSGADKIAQHKQKGAQHATHRNQP